MFLLVPFLINCSGSVDLKTVHIDTVIKPSTKDISIPGSFSPETNLHFDSSEFKILKKVCLISCPIKIN